MGRTDFSDQFRKLLIHHKRIGYDLNVMRHDACFVINPIKGDNFAALFNCMPVDRAAVSMMIYDGPDLKLFTLVGCDWSSFVCCLVPRGSTDDLLLLQISSCVGWQTRDLQISVRMSIRQSNHRRI